MVRLSIQRKISSLRLLCDRPTNGSHYGLGPLRGSKTENEFNAFILP